MNQFPSSRVIHPQPLAKTLEGPLDDHQEQEKARWQEAIESLLAQCENTPQMTRYFQSDWVAPADLREVLEEGLAKLIGGEASTREVVNYQECRYIPPRGWPCYEEATARLDALRDVYPELVLWFEVKEALEPDRGYYVIVWHTFPGIDVKYTQVLRLD